MGAIPEDAADWHEARGLPMRELSGGGHAQRAAQLIARAAALLGRMEGEAAESWLTLGEGLADGTAVRTPRLPNARPPGHAGVG